MINRTQKGKRIERLLEIKLKEKGFLVHKATSNMFNRNDIWGCFDHMAKDPVSPDSTFYFQVSTQWKYGKARQEIEAFPRGRYDRIFMARKPDRKPFEFKEMTGSQWIDLRLETL